METPAIKPEVTSGNRMVAPLSLELVRRLCDIPESPSFRCISGTFVMQDFEKI